MDFNHLNGIQTDINDGKLQSGPLMLCNAGEGVILDFDTETIRDNDYFVFWIGKLSVPGFRKCQIRIPKPTDNPAAQYMGFQRIGATVFGCIKANPKTDRIDLIVEKIKKTLQTHSIAVAYTGKETEFLNQRTGKNSKGWELETLTGIQPVAKVPFARPAKTTPDVASPTYQTGFDDNVPF